MIDRNDYAKRKSLGSLEHLGTTFHIVRPFGPAGKYRLGLAHAGRLVATYYPHGTEKPPTLDEAAAWFRAQLDKNFPTEASMAARLAWLQERGGADV